MEDPNGAIKCQSSSNVQASDLFTPAQEALFAAFKIENNVPASGFTASIPCHADNVICPGSQVCAAGICADPDPSMSTTTTTHIDVETGAAYGMRTCFGIFLLLIGAFGVSPF
mmetsp:Transcript_72107/g.134833  ORF Transcript_72107/g.134833 Transcript_72107/m.134833 type:complete len:113 (+) Transcript_72107:472-810(+)